MLIFQKGNSTEVEKGKLWWKKLEAQWKIAFNEAVFGKGSILAPPSDEELVMLLLRADALRFAGPLAHSPNLSKTLTNLSGIKELTHLTYLSFTHSSIKSLLEIKDLIKLRSLFVYNNKLSNLEGIGRMRDLEELYCLNNKITTIHSIKNLVNLKTVYLNNNKLISLEGLTAEHGDKLRNFYIEPNDTLPHREIIKAQNEFGIICRRAN